MTKTTWLRAARGLFVRLLLTLALLPVVIGAAEVDRKRHVAWVDEQVRLGQVPPFRPRTKTWGASKAMSVNDSPAWHRHVIAK